MRNAKIVFEQEEIHGKTINWYLTRDASPDGSWKGYIPKYNNHELVFFGDELENGISFAEMEILNKGLIFKVPFEWFDPNWVSSEYAESQFQLHTYQYNLEGNLIKFINKELKSPSVNMKVDYAYDSEGRLFSQRIERSYSYEIVTYFYADHRISRILFEIYNINSRTQEHTLRKEEIFNFIFNDIEKELKIESLNWKEIRKYNSNNKLISKYAVNKERVVHDTFYKYDDRSNLLLKKNLATNYEVSNTFDESNKKTSTSIKNDEETIFNQHYIHEDNKITRKYDGYDETFHFDNEGNMEKVIFSRGHAVEFHTKEGILENPSLPMGRWRFKHKHQAFLHEHEFIDGVIPYPEFAVYDHNDAFPERFLPGNREIFDRNVLSRGLSVHFYCSVIDEIDYHEYYFNNEIAASVK